MPMGLFKRLKAKRALVVGSTVTENAEASKSIPNSTTASQNAKSSSAAINELNDVLKLTLHHLDAETIEEFRDFANARFEELQSEAKRYSNAEFDESTSEPWSCSPETAKLIWTAILCSRNVNGQMLTSKIERFELIEEIKPSMLGTRKRVRIWKDSANQLIVAIRASKDPADHMVNLAHTPRDMPGSAKRLKGAAHGGYLSCTEALIPKLQGIFQKIVQSNELINHVLFTGESSGGAVASLLFFHFASQCKRSEIFGNANLSLITFGSPPVTTKAIASDAKRLEGVNLALSFLNDKDFVGRACESYARSMLDLYRQYLDRQSRKRHGAASTTQEQDIDEGIPEVRTKLELPPPTFYHIGKICLLMPSLLNPHLSSPGCFEVEYDDFICLLFCNIDVHKGSDYERRVWAFKKRMMRTELNIALE